jgi:NAD-specific glutamate dehydrogenase
VQDIARVQQVANGATLSLNLMTEGADLRLKTYHSGFNRLVLSAGLSARQIVVLRAYCKLLRQTGSNFSQAYMETTFAAHPNLARLLVKLFETQFDPSGQSDGTPAQEQAIRDGSSRH